MRAPIHRLYSMRSTVRIRTLSGYKTGRSILRIPSGSCTNIMPESTNQLAWAAESRNDALSIDLASSPFQIMNLG